MKLKTIVISNIYDKLEPQLMPYRETGALSNRPGIYLVGYTGTNFPLDNIGKDRVVYIGKTEDSQKARDAGTHFTSGKSGSSTLRRSIGAILKNELSLTAIPRNGKTSRQAINCYEFEGAGEDSVTEWMKDNLSLAFWEYDLTMGKLKDLEKVLIRYRCPILNLQNNPKKSERLKELRKMCREEAKQVALKGSTS